MDEVDWKLRVERKLGVLEEQGRWTAKTVKDVSGQLQEISKDQKALNLSHSTFKARVNAQTTVLGAITALVTTILADFFRR